MQHNPTIELLLNRRSYRKYKDLPIEPEKLETIFAAIQNSPTSMNGQQFSVVAITEQSLKNEIMEHAGGQEHLKKNGILLIFCVDYHKIEHIAKASGQEVPFAGTIESLLVGSVDCALAIQNAVVASLSLGLQTCCIGYIRNKGAQFVSKKLELPQHVFPICGLVIGYSEHQPDLKPKQSIPLFIHYNKYDYKNQLQYLQQYDEVMEKFNGTRADGTKVGNWSSNLIKALATNYNTEPIKGWLKEQGFLK